MSEQNLVDCSGKYGNHGCWGGLMEPSFRYIKDNKGINTEKDYPYKGHQGKCHFNRNAKVVKVTGLKRIKRRSESDLKAAVATQGPVSVAIHVNFGFQMYRSGMYDIVSTNRRFILRYIINSVLHKIYYFIF